MLSVPAISVEVGKHILNKHILKIFLQPLGYSLNIFYVFNHFCCSFLIVTRGDFTDPSSQLDITIDLTAPGYPHIRITEKKQKLCVCVCCLIHEVITKRIAALNGIMAYATSKCWDL